MLLKFTLSGGSERFEPRTHTHTIDIPPGRASRALSANHSLGTNSKSCARAAARASLTAKPPRQPPEAAQVPQRPTSTGQPWRSLFRRAPSLHPLALRSPPRPPFHLPPPGARRAVRGQWQRQRAPGARRPGQAGAGQAGAGQADTHLDGHPGTAPSSPGPPHSPPRGGRRRPAAACWGVPHGPRRRLGSVRAAPGAAPSPGRGSPPRLPARRRLPQRPQPAPRSPPLAGSARMVRPKRPTWACSARPGQVRGRCAVPGVLERASRDVGSAGAAPGAGSPPCTTGSHWALPTEAIA